MLVVLDTNILISALLVQASPPAKLIELWRHGRFTLCVMGLVIEWATIHQEELMADWELARLKANLNAIAPLSKSCF